MFKKNVQPFDLSGLKTYDLASRPSKVFKEDLGKPVQDDCCISEFLNSLPNQLAGKSIRRVRDHLLRARDHGKTVVAAIGGHVIKTGCAPYLIDWMEKGFISAIAMNGSAAIHDVELGIEGKTSEDVGTTLHHGLFGMARETADFFALASRRGSDEKTGLGAAVGNMLAERKCKSPESSLLLAAHQMGIPATVHVALGTDIVHMHPHLSGAAIGEASLTDFRILCTVVSTMAEGIWMNLGSAVIMPEVLLKAVSVARNFGYSLDGFVTVNLDKESRYRSTVNVLNRPSAEGIEITGHHELMIPLLHAATSAALAAKNSVSESKAA